MGVLNIFKKEKRVEEKKIKEAKKLVAPVVKEKKIATKENVVPEGDSSALLISPYLSEKSTTLRDERNKYIFKVITKINIINTPAKPKRWRQKKAYFRRSKKMIVTIKKGQKIELGI